jgi:hypothetical protein
MISKLISPQIILHDEADENWTFKTMKWGVGKPAAGNKNE